MSEANSQQNAPRDPSVRVQGDVRPLTVSDVVRAIRAVDNEAARRVAMFPQTSDEQRDDRRSVRRVVEMLEWYDSNTGRHNIDGWPAANDEAQRRAHDEA